MKATFWMLLVGVALVVGACGSNGDGDAAGGDGGAGTSATDTIATIPVTEPPDVPADLIGTWTVVSAGEVDAPDGVTLTVSSGGGVTGFLGCNEFFGAISTADGQLRFVDLEYSEIGCPDVEDFTALVDALGTVVSAEVGDASTSLSSGDVVVVQLERGEDAAPA